MTFVTSDHDDVRLASSGRGRSYSSVWFQRRAGRLWRSFGPDRLVPMTYHLRKTLEGRPVYSVVGSYHPTFHAM